MRVKQKRKYDSAFKRNTVLLSEEPGHTITEVVESLEIKT